MVHTAGRWAARPGLQRICLLWIGMVTLLAGTANAELAGLTTLDADAVFKTTAAPINFLAYSSSAIMSYGDAQYATWYGNNGNGTYQGMIARRRLHPVGNWEITTLPFSITSSGFADSRNSLSMGISPGDGRIHITWNLHDSKLYYLASEQNMVNPVGIARSWTSSRFNSPRNDLLGLVIENNIAYSYFVASPVGNLQMFYRVGSSVNGTLNLAEFNGSVPTNTSWTRLGQIASSTYGTYTTPSGKTSGPTDTRAFFMHGATYSTTNGKLHIYGTWREGNSSLQCSNTGVANHDTVYVNSADYGRTFRAASGLLISTTGQTTGTLTVDDASTIIDTLGPDYGLTNQESQVVDSKGAPFVLISYVPGRFTSCVTDFVANRTSYARNFLIRKVGTNAFNKTEIPFALNSSMRSQLVLDKSDNAYVVRPDFKILRATAASLYSDWTVLFNFADVSVYPFSEPTIDKSRAASDQILSILFQTPNGIQVADVAMKPKEV
ncbi:uncharacterized protein EV422DRAFT_529445 [Fimicolochytrium jonesii]|uniref:uncharacterized protein n=1 Tax=Fimicolochytrium jonesii TaxID=1396493 RepID=UPI0022FDF181|nr:uncharacterized protein EV422DRAFT_529445 [Fimicolochytrium jonesii]KAI8821164.1 hypothetical protein EV422DRAFT_529445 [Fimicolochytrium jonesii]